MKQTGYDRESVLDLAVIAGGSLDCAISLCIKNDLCLSDDAVLGTEYDTDCLENLRDANKRVIDIEVIRPATALSEADVEACPYGGIGFMGIEIDFEVS